MTSRTRLSWIGLLPVFLLPVRFKGPGRRRAGLDSLMAERDSLDPGTAPSRRRALGLVSGGLLPARINPP